MRRRQRVWLIALLIGGLAMMPLPWRTREVGALLDLAHAPAFGVLAWAAWSGLRPRLPGWPRGVALLTWAGLILVGAAIELIQGLTGRSPTWHDLVANGLGSGATLIWISTPRAPAPHVPLGRLAVVASLFAIPLVPPVLILTDSGIQLRDRPRLASFEQPLELSRWEFEGCRAIRSRAHATDGIWSLMLVLDRGANPAATLAWPIHDWSAYTTLEFDAYLDPGPPLDLVLKIEDQEHDGRYEDRYHHPVRLVPGPNRARIALGEVERAPRGRKLDLTRVRRLQLFAPRAREATTIYIDEIILK